MKLIMNLYHFTCADRAQQIAKDGLLPDLDARNMVGGADVVWLTERTDLSITRAESADVYERSGVLMTEWLVINSPRRVRLTVRIPTHDRKLFKYRPWLLKHRRPGMPDPYDGLFLPHWIYFDMIPPSKIVGVADLLDAARQTEAA